MDDRLFVVQRRQQEYRDEADGQRLIAAAQRATRDGRPGDAARRIPPTALPSRSREGSILARVTPNRELVDRARTDDPCLPAGRPC